MKRIYFSQNNMSVYNNRVIVMYIMYFVFSKIDTCKPIKQWNGKLCKTGDFKSNSKLNTLPFHI